jgi:uncharacterized NAD-dependent epimerase/dehydratase family protein
VILAEGRFHPTRSKTANAAIAYLRDEVVAVIDSTQSGRTVGEVLGYGGTIPVVRDLESSFEWKPDTLLIGIAPAGGQLPAAWRPVIVSALKRGLNILNGLHTIFSRDEEFSRLAAEHHCTITDWRSVQGTSQVVARGHWRKRNAFVVLTVGTDCNIGKMTTGIEVYRELLTRGIEADFVATGQTGIMISGRGVAVDALMGDYIAGGIEQEIMKSEERGAEVIIVEGQGSLTHQGYSGVTLGLLHGCMPDAMILCHQPSRQVDDYGMAIPDLSQLIRFHEDAIGFFRPSRVICIGLNSAGLTNEQSVAEEKRIELETGLPAIDTFRFGAGKLVDILLDSIPARSGLASEGDTLQAEISNRSSRPFA